MIRISFFIWITCILSCRPDTKTTTSSTPPPTDIKTPQGSVPFAGNWLSEDYLEDIRTHKSPRKAQETSEDCFIHIPDQAGQSTTMAYNFHEAGPELSVVKRNDGYQLWEIQNGIQVKEAYQVERISGDKMTLNNKTFIKIQGPVEKNGKGVLENILFAGSYITKTGQRVEFKNDGKMVGLDSYAYYTPVLDYFDAGLQVDQIGLGMNRESLTYFGFKFKGETLELYTLKCKVYDDSQKRCVDVGFGDKAYVLKKETAD